jgi:UDP-MurNAc hydroxylase
MWFPAVYRWPVHRKEKLATATRRAQTERAKAYIESIGARHVFPCAGPPCFLDDDLLYLNDVSGNPTGIFPDQVTFLQYLATQGVTGGHLLFPGSVITLQGAECTVAHPGREDELIDTIFRDKRAYLERYARDMAPLLRREQEQRRVEGLSIVEELRGWFEPLLEQADQTCAGIGARVLLDCGDEAAVVDFETRRVKAHTDEHCAYRFFVPRWLIEQLIREHDVDWVNSLFLSCRLEAERDAGYNEWVYSFFKGLSAARMRHLEFVYGEPLVPEEFWQSDGYRIQRRCPHFKADLTKFGRIADGVLTCTMHGWQFDLATGACLTAHGRTLQTTRLAEE